LLPEAHSVGRLIRVRDGLRLHIVSTGPHNGPPVILLHGFPEFWWAWREQLRYLDSIGFRAIAVDLRGFNLSDKPSQGYDPETLAGDIDCLLDALGYEHAIIMGSDLGGIVAYALALLHPDKVEKLIILNALHPAVWPSRRRSGWLGSWIFVTLAKMGHFMGSPLIAAANEAIGIGAAIKWLSNNRKAFGPAVRRPYKEAYKRSANTATLYGPESAEWLMTRLPDNLHIQHPTLILWPEKDLSAPTWVTRSTHETIPNAQVIIVPNAGHWIHEEQPEAVNEAIGAFLGKSEQP
jgi:epoxide hydrolase 4